METLLDRQADVNHKGGSFKGGALNEAAAYGHQEVVRMLYDHGADLDVSMSLSNPVFCAITGGHLDMVKLLVQLGVDYSISYTTETMDGMNAVTFAPHKAKTQLQRILNPSVRSPTRKVVG